MSGKCDDCYWDGHDKPPSLDLSRSEVRELIACMDLVEDGYSVKNSALYEKLVSYLERADE